MSSVDEGDLTARATIRNAALRLFAERGPDRVTVRDIAAEAGVSPSLIVHHFGSKDGLRAAVDEHAARVFDSLLETDGAPLAEMLGGRDESSLATAFARNFPRGSPLPAYLRRLLLTGDPAGAALFGRWFSATLAVLRPLEEGGLATRTDDPAVRAAFLLVNDLALILLRNEVASAIGVDPLTPEGIARWGREVLGIYTEGVFRSPPEETGRGTGDCGA